MTTQLEPELLPCPFCGKPAKFEDGGFNAIRVACSDFDCEQRGRVHKRDKNCHAKLAARWNSRVSDGGVVATVDHEGLAEWLDMLVSALQASQKFDYNEWGQFIMGAENWADKLRAASLPPEPRDYCAGASCAECNRDDCTCSHHDERVLAT